MTHRQSQYNVDTFFVYKSTCEHKCYVGASSVLKGQSLRCAVAARKRYMQKVRVAWLNDVDVNGVQVEVIFPSLQKKDALIEEARLTAAEYLLSAGGDVVRGGPWCRKVLPNADKDEIRLVNACTSRAAVEQVAFDLSGGSLAYHLAGKTYKGASEKPGRGNATSTLGGNAKGALIITNPKKVSGRSGKSGNSGRSGRYAAGIKRISGKHHAGWRPSGRHKPGVRKRPSGSQSSGAHRRFNALPVRRK